MNPTSRVLAICCYGVFVHVLLTGCAPTGIGDPCEPEVESSTSIVQGEIVIETSSLQCRTRVCMKYNNVSFCTKKCTKHSDCNADWFESGPGEDLSRDERNLGGSAPSPSCYRSGGDCFEDKEEPPAYCGVVEVNIPSAPPGVKGKYCVPFRALPYDF